MPMNERYCLAVDRTSNRLSSNVQYLFKKKFEVDEIAAPRIEASRYHTFDNNLIELATSLAKRKETI
jgi:phosphoribulokinase